MLALLLLLLHDAKYEGEVVKLSAGDGRSEVVVTALSHGGERWELGRRKRKVIAGLERKGWVLLVVNGGVGDRGVGFQEGKVAALGAASSSLLYSNSS